LDRALEERTGFLTDADRQGLNAQALAGHINAKMTAHYIKEREIPVVKSPSFGARKT